MSTSAPDLAIAFLIPLLPVLLVLLAPLTLSTRYQDLACRLAPWLPLSMLTLASLHGKVVEMPWLLLGTRIGVDDISLAPILLATVAWTLAGWHARRHLDSAGQPRFFFFWLLAFTGNLCVFITLDAASFYAAYAMMSVAAYGLVVHYGQAEDFRAGRVYLVMALLGEALLVLALMTAAADAGNFALELGGPWHAHRPAMWVSALFMVGFGVKTGLVLLHMWLPLAHPRAPVPASAVLSGVMLTAGLMGWLRFLPLGLDGYQALGEVLLGAGVISAFYGVLAGLAQVRPKSVLAYSRVSQMGLVAVIVALALLHPGQAGLYSTLAVLFALHHGLAKTALFLGIDLVAIRPRLARAVLWLPAFALAGAPLTSGALAKTVLDAQLPSVQAGWLAPVLLASSVATTCLMLRFLVIALRAPAGGHASQRMASARPWLALVALGQVLPWVAYGAADPDWPAIALQPANVTAKALPVLAGIVLAGAGAAVFRRTGWPRIPEGDLLVLLRFPRGALTRLRAIAIRRPATQPSLARCERVLEMLERGLARLGPALLGWLLLLGALFVVS